MKKTYIYSILYLLSFFNLVYSLPKREDQANPIGASIKLTIEGTVTCTSGFPVKGGVLGDTDTGLLIAGHCATKNEVGDRVYKVNDDGTEGPIIGHIFKISYGNGNDFALVKLENGWFGSPNVIGPGTDGKPATIPIVASSSPEEAFKACLTGSASGIVCGQIMYANKEGTLNVQNKFNKDENIVLEGLNVLDTATTPTRIEDSGAGVYVATKAPHAPVMLAGAVGIYVESEGSFKDNQLAYYYPISTVLEAFGGLILITHSLV